MKRHTLLSTLWLAFGLVRLPLTADAQQATKLHCLGWLAIVRRWRLRVNGDMSWSPKVALRDGLSRTIAYFEQSLMDQRTQVAAE